MNAIPIPPPLVNGRSGWPWEAAEPPPATKDSFWPTITIVTPSYNQAAYLEETIRSVLLQQYPALEYIIMDGGSTDGSVDIIRHYANHLAYWQSEPDDGQADAINKAFARANGEIMGWLNSDDVYMPGTLSVIGRLFAGQPETQLAYGEGWYIDPAGNRLEPCRFVRRKITDTYLANMDPILQPAAFWRRSLWDATGPLNSSLHWVFDWEWFIRAHKQTNFHYIPKALAYYRVQPQAKTRTGGIERQLEHASVTRHYGAWWHPNNVVQQLRRFEHGTQVITAAWPSWLAAPLRGLTAGPRVIAERVLHGTYMP
ncbi:MAG: glycosyltransferase family 2 protein [Chloroflexota bacterium]